MAVLLATEHSGECHSDVYFVTNYLQEEIMMLSPELALPAGS